MANVEDLEDGGLRSPLLAKPSYQQNGTCGSPTASSASGASDEGSLPEEVPPAFSGSKQHGHAGTCHWLQTTTALLTLQLGWGLWLFPSDFARLGWIPGLGEYIWHTNTESNASYIVCNMSSLG